MNKPHQITRRVYVEHTDQSGYVYHGRYLDFFQQGRTEWLRSNGITLNDVNGFFVVHRMDIRYKKPLFLDQTFVVSTTPISQKYYSITLHQTLTFDDELCCQATLKLALLDNHNQPQKITSLLEAMHPSAE